MKYLISLIFLTGCVNLMGPRFKAGDCALMRQKPEKWEPQRYPEKILEVGKNKYRLAVISEYTKNVLVISEPIDIEDSVVDKVDCPDMLKNYREK